jgi:amino acid transporter
MIHTTTFADATKNNSDRLRREKHLKLSKQLDKHHHWQGIGIAVMVGLSIAIILFCAFFPALSYMIDNLPPAFWTIFLFAAVASLIIFYRGRKDRNKATRP